MNRFGEATLATSTAASLLRSGLRSVSQLALAFSLLSHFGAAPALAQDVSWRAGFNSTASSLSSAGCFRSPGNLQDFDASVTGRHAAMFPNGDVVVTGCAHNGSGSDVLTVRYDGSSGAMRWSAVLTGPAVDERSYSVGPANFGYEEARDVVVDAGGDVVVIALLKTYANGGRAARLAKYRGGDGQLLWSVDLASPLEQPDWVSVTVDENGDAYPMVSSVGAVRFSSRASGTGAELWSTTLSSDQVGARSWFGARGLVVDAAGGDLYAVGTFYGSGNLRLGVVRLDRSNGAVRWAMPSGGDSDPRIPAEIVLDPAGHVIVLRVLGRYGEGATVAKHAKDDGALAWSKAIPLVGDGIDRTAFHGIRIDSAGHVLLAGSDANGPYERGLVFKLSGSDGSELWRQGLAEPETRVRLFAIALDAAGNAFVTGAASSLTRESIRTYKLAASNGAVSWTATREAPSLPYSYTDAGSAVRVDASGNVVVAGQSLEPDRLYPRYRVLKYEGGTGAEMWSATAPGIPGTEQLHGKQVSAVRNGRVAMLAYSPVLDDEGARLTLHDAADGRLVWEARIDGISRAYGDAPRVALDDQGNVVVVGARDGTAWTARFSASTGALDWSATFQPVTSIYPYQTTLVVDSGDAIVAASVEGRSWLRRYRADGTVAWTTEIASPGQLFPWNTIQDLSVDTSGDVVAAGLTNSDTYRGRILKLPGATGVIQWTGISGWSITSHARLVTTDSRGSVFAVLQGEPASGGDRTRQRIEKYSSTGTLLWTLASEEALETYAIAIDAAGHLVVASGLGRVEYESGWRLQNIHGGTGAVRWQDDFILPGRGGHPAALAIDGQANVVVAGFTGSRALGRDAHVAKWDGLSGQRLWNRALTEPRFDGVATALSLDASDAIYVGGMLSERGYPNGSLLLKIVGGPTQGAMPPGVDSDDDGIPNAVEVAEGLRPRFKDNDIFASSRLFAMQQYRDFFGREGDAGGIAYFQQQLTGGSVNRAQVVETFLSSPEFQNGPPQVARLYLSFFNRIPDYPGFVFQVGQFRSGVPLDVIAQNFAQSPEFTGRYGAMADGQYVNLVYRNVLGRAPDPAGDQYYRERLNDGRLTRGQLMIGFSESPEFQRLVDDELFVMALYAGLLRRSPQPVELENYVRGLESGATRRAVIETFLAAPEYRARFLP